jgi:hypothetical protein
MSDLTPFYGIQNTDPEPATLINIDSFVSESAILEMERSTKSRKKLKRC